MTLRVWLWQRFCTFWGLALLIFNLRESGDRAKILVKMSRSFSSECLDLIPTSCSCRIWKAALMTQATGFLPSTWVHSLVPCKIAFVYSTFFFPPSDPLLPSGMGFNCYIYVSGFILCPPTNWFWPWSDLAPVTTLSGIPCCLFEVPPQSVSPACVCLAACIWWLLNQRCVWRLCFPVHCFIHVLGFPLLHCVLLLYLLKYWLRVYPWSCRSYMLHILSLGRLVQPLPTRISCPCTNPGPLIHIWA